MLKKLKNTVVHCKTKEEYDRLMKIYEEVGWKWRDGELPTEYRHLGRHTWGDEREETCVTVQDRFSFAGRSWYSGKRVISLPEFLRIQGLDTLKLEDLQAGDWVEVVEDFEYMGVKCGKGTRYEVGSENTTGLVLKCPNPGRHDGMWYFHGCQECVRKCSPPEEPVSRTACTLSMAIVQSGQWNGTTLCNPPPISSPSLLMSAWNFIKRQARSADDNNLIDAGLVNECGELTVEGRVALEAFTFEAYKDKLVKLAKDMLAEQEKKK